MSWGGQRAQPLAGNAYHDFGPHVRQADDQLRRRVRGRAFQRTAAPASAAAMGSGKAAELMEKPPAVRGIKEFLYRTAGGYTFLANGCLTSRWRPGIWLLRPLRLAPDP